MYPVRLKLAGRRCLVVGGGAVALRKVQGLLAEGGVVTLVSPELVAGLEDLARAGTIDLEQRRYRSGDCAGYALIMAATDDRAVNREIFEEAGAAGIWVNVADDPELCSFHLGGRVRLGPLELFVSSGGDAPFLVRRLRQMLERRLGESWGEWAEAASRLRDELRRGEVDSQAQEAIFDRFFAESLDSERLEVSVPTAADIQRWRVAAETPGELGRRNEGPGFVSLVGAGPGHPGLLTVLGRERLFAADAVVYDRLAEPALPPELPERIQLYDVGKTAGRHPVPQEEISALLIRLARDGQRVVRFKGGDPYVFGRGSEEALALGAAKIPYEVVPAVTAGIAAGAYAGIPVTHRGEALRVTLVTAHESATSGGLRVDWERLAGDPYATLVGYMGVSALPEIVGKLLSFGMDPQTPAALVERGTTSAQRTQVSTLACLCDDVARAGMAPPALFFIGPTVRHSEDLDWFSRLPLAGRRIVLPTPSSKLMPGLKQALERAGAETLRVPIPLRQAGRVVLRALPVSGWVLTDERAVRVAVEECSAAGALETSGAWCCGEDLTARAHELGLVGAICLGAACSAEEWVDEIHASL